MSPIGSSFDEVLEGQGARDETIAIASKRVLAWQISHAKQEGHISRDEMAEKMGTTHSLK